MRFYAQSGPSMGLYRGYLRGCEVLVQNGLPNELPPFNAEESIVHILLLSAGLGLFIRGIRKV